MSIEFPLSSPSSSLSSPLHHLTSPLFGATPTLSNIFDLLPTATEGAAAYYYFSAAVDRYSHPIHVPTFQRRWASLKEQLAQAPAGPARDSLEVDPFFLATELGVCVAGMGAMKDEAARALGMPGIEERNALVKKWMGGAVAALTAGKVSAGNAFEVRWGLSERFLRFLDNPTLEGVRAATITATYYVFMSPGEALSTGM